MVDSLGRTQSYVAFVAPLRTEASTILYHITETEFSQEINIITNKNHLSEPRVARSKDLIAVLVISSRLGSLELSLSNREEVSQTARVSEWKHNLPRNSCDQW